MYIHVHTYFLIKPSNFFFLTAVTSSVYGVQLTSLGRDVPGVVRECVLACAGLEVQGIYRLSGRRNNVMKLKEELDKGKGYCTYIRYAPKKSVRTFCQYF